jgi:hypothetical protein
MSVLFGRFFQLVGLVTLPIGLYIGAVKNNVNVEVKMLFIGAGFFVAGWLMARRRR